MVQGKEMKKIALGSVAAIAAATLVFGGIGQAVKAAEVGKTQTVPTRYSLSDAAPSASGAPANYVKKDYQVKLVGDGQPTANDMKPEEAAELAGQNLWRVFGVDLSGRTLEVTYAPASATQLRAKWVVDVIVDESLAYRYALDAVTGEHHTIAKQVFHKADIPEGADFTLLKDNEEYRELAKAAAEKYGLVSGPVASVEYVSQGFQKNRAGDKNADITFQVKSDEGETAQLSFSRYNKELLSVEFASWLEDAELIQQRMEQEMKETEDLVITDEVLKKVQDTGTPIQIRK